MSFGKNTQAMIAMTRIKKTSARPRPWNKNHTRRLVGSKRLKTTTDINLYSAFNRGEQVLRGGRRGWDGILVTKFTVTFPYSTLKIRCTFHVWTRLMEGRRSWAAKAISLVVYCYILRWIVCKEVGVAVIANPNVTASRRSFAPNFVLMLTSRWVMCVSRALRGGVGAGLAFTAWRGW